VEHVIPSEWFQDLHGGVLLGLVGVSMVALMFGADRLVESASALARRLGVPEIIVGATIVSLGTTAPECAVSVMAAWEGNSGLALGNAVGSVIADTGLIFGLGCLLTRLPVNRFLLVRQGWVQFGSAVLLAGLCYVMWWLHGDSAVVPRWAGAMFLLLLVAYMFVSVRWSLKGEALEGGLETDVTSSSSDESESDEESQRPMVLLGVLLFGVVVVVLSSHVLIESVEVMARRLSVPDVVLSATLVAFGTSLPELVVGVTAIRRGHPELLVGNVIGADVLNVLFVIGASAIAAELPIVAPATGPQAVADVFSREIFLRLHLPTMLLILLTFRCFIFRAIQLNTFQRWMGAPLVLGYVAFVILNAFYGGGVS
jgi:cation:H+ antiporter